MGFPKQEGYIMVELRPEEAFMMGYKPACTCQKGNPRLKPYFDRLVAGEYPCFLMNHLNTYMFFHTEEQKLWFLRKIEGLRYNSPEYIRILGIELGFPKKSVEYFAHLWEQEEKGVPFKVLHRDAVGVNCSGFVFKTHIDYLVEEVSWIWNTYNLPKEAQCPTRVGYEESMYYVEYGDYRQLRETQEIIRREIGLVQSKASG